MRKDTKTFFKVSITSKQRDHLKGEAERLGINISELVRRLLDIWIEGGMCDYPPFHFVSYNPSIPHTTPSPPLLYPITVVYSAGEPYQGQSIIATNIWVCADEETEK